MNELTHATSPYLLQHAENPVHWRQWGDSGFVEARERDVPIFLSVGYSSCHWCHVMAHESFEDPDTAALLNDRFVSIKVDREERPDVDAVYMQAVTALSGHGGWPMSVFLAPDGRPFFGGTYWPDEPRHGMPSFRQVLAAVDDAWQQRRDEVVESSEQITQTLANHAVTSVADDLDARVTDEAAQVVLEQAWDREHGGFGRAPKFPQAMTIEWLLVHHARTGSATARDAAVQALDAMARGGIHDQLAGGFARYATDDDWLVPHFEKMLTDSALLLPAYAAAAALTGREDLADVARSTVRFLLDDFRADDGLFVAASDADSEGVEGKYFVWSFDEFADVVAAAGADVDVFAAYFDVTESGNWEGANILHVPVGTATFVAQRGLDGEKFSQDLERVRHALRSRRETRVAPAVDTKVLADANALACRGLVVAGRLLGEPAWICTAREIITTLVERLEIDRMLHHSIAGGELGAPGFLEDHAAVTLAELEVFAATGDRNLFDRALARAEETHARFIDEDRGDWFQTASDAESLYLRPKTTWDNATPSGTSVMIEVCLTLADLTGDDRWRERAEAALVTMQPSARRMPTGFGWALRQFETLVATRRQLAVVGDEGADRAALAAIAERRVLPGVRTVVATPRSDENVPLLLARTPVDGQPAAYLCRNLTCERPVTTPDALAELLDAAG
ncbi:MAG: thioredoxin domain-containing protein [Nitriliruptoraceae bacterium]